MKRGNARQKVGLVLGSGAARGLAHIGVLKVLEEEGIPIDMIAGTSIGALVGAFYAHGESIERLEELAIDLGLKRFSFLVDPSLPKTGLLRGRRLERTLKSVLRDTRFTGLKIPFACVATDIYSGEEVVLRDGLVWDAVRASFSLPVAFAVVKRDGKYLVDGGLTDPMPVHIAREMGADCVIAVNVIPRDEVRVAEPPNIFTVIMRTVHIASYQMIKASLAGVDAVIEPAVEHIGYADFHRAPESISQGELAARKAIPEIRKRLSITK